jgi:ferredoxin
VPNCRLDTLLPARRGVRDMLKDHDRVLLVGCGTCVTVCLAGGEREV